MKTAIITGASTGLGAHFAAQLHGAFPGIEQVWLIARRRDRLEKTAAAVCGPDVKILALDLCSDNDLNALRGELEREKPSVSLLVNNAGCGYLGDMGETDTDKQIRMVDLNIRAVTAISNMVIPYLSDGGKIINMSSIASFCPNPRMTVYSSSKAYISSFSRGLREELRPRGINVTAVCSGPLDTEFLELGGIKGNSKMFKLLPYCKPEKVVAGAYRASKAGRAVYTPRVFFKFYRLLAKILPQALVVKFAKT